MRPVANIRRSITLRLTLATIVLSLAVAMAATATQMFFVHRAQVATYQQELDQIGRSEVPALENGLWQVEKTRIDLLMNAIANVPGVGYVELNTESMHDSRGKADVPMLMQRRYPLNHTEGTSSFPLGSLRVVINWNVAQERLLNNAFRNLIATTVTLLATAFLLLLLLRLWVTRNLRAMADYAGKLHLDRLDQPLVLPHPSHPEHPDELNQVALALNQMRERMLEEFQVRLRHEHELDMHRKHLESMVQARTAALERKTKQLDEQRMQMQQLANTDSLTGACSRRHFLALFGQELRRSQRDRRPLAVMMLDVDHFKRINDTHGHAIGDRVLTLLVQTCRDELRDVDIMGRLGGEEFAIILPQSNLDQAVTVAERLRTAIHKLTLQNDRGETLSFTTSIGISARREPVDDEDALLARADAALYRAKHEGRDRICTEQVVAS